MPRSFEIGQPQELKPQKPGLWVDGPGYTMDDGDVFNTAREKHDAGADGLLIVNFETLPESVLKRLSESEDFDAAMRHNSQVFRDTWRQLNWKDAQNMFIVWDDELAQDYQGPASPAEVEAMTDDQILDLFSQGKISQDRVKELMASRRRLSASPTAPGTKIDLKSAFLDLGGTEAAWQKNAKPAPYLHLQSAGRRATDGFRFKS